MKKTYMKPTMLVVEIKHHGILCTSPRRKSVDVWNESTDDIIDDENEVY